MNGDLIIGFDGSDAGRDGLALGRRIALATGARVTVVYVRSYMALTDDARESGEDLPWAEAADRVLDEAREMLADVPDASFRAVAERSAARSLRAAAQVAEAGVVVLGSTTRAGLGRVAPGTTADQILQSAPCAVAVAPAGYAGRTSDQPFHRIGAAVNGGAESDRVARIAAGVARRAGATLRLLTVVERSAPRSPLYTTDAAYAGGAAEGYEHATDILEQATLVAGGGVQIERRIADGHPAEELIAESGDLDLLVVGSRGFGPLRRIVPGSTSAKVVRSAACPLIVLPRGAVARIDAVVAVATGERVPSGDR